MKKINEWNRRIKDNDEYQVDLTGKEVRDFIAAQIILISMDSMGHHQSNGHNLQEILKTLDKIQVKIVNGRKINA